MVDVAYIFKYNIEFKETIFYYVFMKLTNKFLSDTKQYLWNLYKVLYQDTDNITTTTEKFIDFLILYNKHKQRKIFDETFVKLMALNLDSSVSQLFEKDYSDNVFDEAHYFLERLEQGFDDTDVLFIYKKLSSKNKDLFQKNIDIFKNNQQYLFLLEIDINDTVNKKKYELREELIMIIKQHNITDKELICKLAKIYFMYHNETSDKRLVFLYLELVKLIMIPEFLDHIYKLMIDKTLVNKYEKITRFYELGIYDSKLSKLEKNLTFDEVLESRKHTEEHYILNN